MEKKLLFSLLRIFLGVGIVLVPIWIYIAQPTIKENSPSELRVDLQRLQAHVKTLSQEYYPRNYTELGNLNQSSDYIKRHFEKAGADVTLQEFSVSQRVYTNVIGKFGEGKGRKLILGAHYDTYDQTPGADDNASGVAGLIEIAYLLGQTDVDREVELVAYTLEEPPYFDSFNMGSYTHAAKIQEENQEIEGVIVLEMIGYFSNERGSQSYPTPLLKLIYPNRGNFIAVVGRFDQRKFTRNIKIRMKNATDLPVYSINAPKSLPGIDFSDHRNYWLFGMNAVMVTDTAFYRNKEYHTLKDTFDRLDYKRMEKVVISVFEAIRKLRSK